MRVKIWTEICEKRLAGNFRALGDVVRERAGEGVEAAASSDDTVAVLAVVKADAYGHGIDPCARVLAAAGAKWLGVTDAGEGVRVRQVLRAAGVDAAKQPQVLVMSGTAGLPGEAEVMVREGLTPVVWTREQIARVAEAAGAARQVQRTDVAGPVRVHVEVDSGMSRQGAAPGVELAAILQTIAQEPAIALGGVMTHFASTEVAHSAQTAQQRRSFEQALEQVREARLRPEWVHAGNSSFIDNEDGEGELAWLRRVAGGMAARAMVRSGLALYGYVLPVEGDGVAAAADRIQPVMTWKTRVLAVSEVPAGALVGYNGTFRAERGMRLAVLPVGYADGLRREMSCSNERPGGWVMVRGQRAAIAGRVSMNLTTVDVSGIPGVVAGDEVVLLGEGISAEDHAGICGTIAYEILCGVGRGA